MATNKNSKIWVIWGFRGHPRSSETLPFDRAHDFLFDFNINYMSILYRFRLIAHFSSKVTNVNPPHLHLSLPLWVIPFRSNFAVIFGNRKLDSRSYRVALFA